MITRRTYTSEWRGYQRRLQGKALRKRLLKRLPLLGMYSVCTGIFLVFVFWSGSWILGYLSQASYGPKEAKEKSIGIPEKLSRKDLSGILKNINLHSAYPGDHFILKKGGERLALKTSIDPALQKYILGMLRRSRTQSAAVVALRPDDGRILAMASFDRGGNRENLCLKADFPAASLFKVISAAAALEAAGFTPDQNVFFYGRKHTLYKGQLRHRTGKYTTRTSFRQAFASSINSVFGKLGIYDLGQVVMTEYAARFFFNRQIPFDLPIGISSIKVPDDNFGLAEIASGFNRKTLISPLHAALIASTVANNGVMMTPWLVERISIESGNVLYEGRPAILASPISRGTAKDLKTLMRETVRSGTCRKAFQKVRRKKAFKGVYLGAKTGTINDKMDRFKYDWLVAFVLPQDSARALCIAILDVHGEKLGIRASELGKYIINYYLTS